MLYFLLRKYVFRERSRHHECSVTCKCSCEHFLTMNPIGAIGGHIAMHIASVLHGINTTTQLPPHY